MAANILNSAISTIVPIITFVVKAALVIIVALILYLIAVEIYNKLKDIFGVSVQWIKDVLFALGVLLCTFLIVLILFYYLAPSSLCVDLNTSNHNSEIDLFSVSIEGTYVETNTGYLIAPNLPFSFPVVPKLPITKTDKTHMNIMWLKFVDKQPTAIPGHPNVSNAVYCFVPDRG